MILAGATLGAIEEVVSGPFVTGNATLGSDGFRVTSRELVAQSQFRRGQLRDVTSA